MKNAGFAAIVFSGLLLAGCSWQENMRRETSLNGTWNLARTETESLPETFTSSVPVPGLVDMAEPRVDGADSSYTHSVFWYRTRFKTETDKDLTLLRINKSMYHTRVYVNGHFAGGNVWCYTPSVFDIKPFLKNGEENELILSVGCRDQLPDTVVNGHDFEKIVYQPGIYDDVKLIAANFPYITNVQIVPDPIAGNIRIAGDILTGPAEATGPVKYRISELASGKKVTEGKIAAGKGNESGTTSIDFTLAIPGCHLWTPEDPFLYTLDLSTTGDNKSLRFGVRSFRIDREKGVAVLNGKPYRMRGTNVCIFRFFEDPGRGHLPWDREWPVKLHERFKDMNWNSMRYCIGFPPERWYDIADSLGLLIQDEFPVWTGGKGGFEKWQPNLTANELAEEYTAWMKERWNHPSVVIWDAQNESENEVTGRAINKVRHLDLSNRPWDNGWAAPAGPGDILEAHPYLFSTYNFSDKKPGTYGILYDLLSGHPTPDNSPNEHSPDPSGQKYNNPFVINEYGWLWLNRDGSPTTLTDRIYRDLYPSDTTASSRFEVYARNLAILTEYWRASRTAAAVIHFCGLGYSRPDPPRGQTSDHFIDIQNLEFEQHFYEHLKQAFNPLGVMVELWKDHFAPGTVLEVPIHLTNDRDSDWKGDLTLTLTVDDSIVSRETLPAAVDALGSTVLNGHLAIPTFSGQCRYVAEITDGDQTIKSTREFGIR